MVVTSSSEGSPSLLDRILSTPKSIRKKFKITQDKPIPASTEGAESKPNPVKESPQFKKSVKNGFVSFSCRYLGKRIIYTLKPEDCYDFGINLAESGNEKTSYKVRLAIESKLLQMSYLPATPLIPRQKVKSAHINNNQQKINKLNHGRSTSRPFSDYNLQSPTTVFDKRPISIDDTELLFSSDTVNRPTGQVFNGFSSHRERSHTFSGLVDHADLHCNKRSCSLPDEERILLHDIAYCVTIPNRPRIFLLTSRGREGLVCRVFLFTSREKTQVLKDALAQQFQKAYAEWQARTMRRSRRASQTILASIPPERVITSTNSSLASPEQRLSGVDEVSILSKARLEKVADSPLSLSRESSDQDAVSSSDEEDNLSKDEKVALHREFCRRASCLHNPEQLSVGDGQRSNQSGLTVCGSSGDPFSSDEEDECISL